MRKILILLAVCLPLVGFSAPDNEVPFLKTTVESGKQMAAAQNRLLFVYFAAEWCMPCQWMKKNTFTDPQLKQLLQDDFIALKQDVDEVEGFTEKERFDITHLPTILVFNASGQLLARYERSMPSEALIEELQLLNTARNRKNSGYAQNTLSAPSPTLDLNLDRPSLAKMQKTTLSPTTVKPAPTYAAAPGYEATAPQTEQARKPVVYGVQLADFREYSKVVSFVSDIERRAQTKAHIFVDQGPNGNSYKVIVGKYTDRQEAFTSLSRLQQLGLHGKVKEIGQL